MKFVYFGYDFAIDTVQRLLDEGHELLGVFTFPCDNIFSFNTRLMDLAKNLDVPITTEKANQATLDHWIERGCEVFLSAGYLYKIPHIDDSKAYGINIHPSRLPRGRGIMPLPTILMSAPEAAGITAHKIIDEIDAGDILVQHPIDINSDETVETLSSRIAMYMPDMASHIFQNIADLWSAATPQNPDEAETFPAPTDATRTINWDNTVKDIKTLHRAFGRFGVLFTLKEDIWVAYSLNGWPENHSHAPGTITHTTAREIILAAKDGYICITEAEKIQDNIEG